MSGLQPGTDSHAHSLFIRDIISTLLDDHVRTATVHRNPTLLTRPPPTLQDLFAQYALADRVTQSVRDYRAATMVRFILWRLSSTITDSSWTQEYLGAIKGVAESRSDDIMAAYVRDSRVSPRSRVCR